MKYVRKIAILIAVTLFALAVAMGVCIIYSVRNINVSVLNYDGSYDAGAEIKKAITEGYRGRLISSVSEEDVEKCLTEDFVLSGFEKVYPCTINVAIKERRETFAERKGEAYAIYDEDGLFLRNSETYFNQKDGAPNIITEGLNAETVSSAKIFKKHFNSLRSTVEEIEEVTAQSSYEDNKTIFHLRCGLTIEVRGNDLVEEKLSRAAETFSNLTGEQKLGGRIYCYTTNEGFVRATYDNML